MAALTKLDLAIGLSERIGLSRIEAKEIVELFFEEIRKSLEGGENVHISGYGNFDLRDKIARPGRNPKTGEPYEISKRRVVTFHAGLKLKARVQESLGNDENTSDNNPTTSEQ